MIYPGRCCFTVPPGTGKSWLARAIGNSADFTVVTATFGQWQAEGHLGDMLKAMRQCFHNARAAMPTVLIIDEIDSVGSREDRDPRNRSYRTQVINAFLAELDAISREKGLIVIGTCNHRELIDPAVMRAGRFDLKIELPSARCRCVARGVATAFSKVVRDVLTGSCAERGWLQCC